MPIKIADGLSAKEKLHEEGIFTIDKGMALHQDIRPLRILILNLMPLKKPTELQLLRLLGDSPLQVEVDFCHTETHESTHTDPSYLEENYYVFDEIKDNYYDGLIITGAPVEQIPFESVDYWPEMKTYFEWAKTHAFSTLHFCWGAQAALYYYYGIEKRLLPAKLFGIFEYQLTQKHHPLLRGFDDRYFIPQSRHTAINDIQVYNTPQLDILSRSVENGINIIGTPDHRRFFVLGHFEYDRRTLEEEYLRDKKKGLPIAVPKNYYPNDNDTKRPYVTWCSYAHLFYHNWLNIVYQETPYDLQAIAKVHPCAH
ncbi:MAG: homoserine O-succinyltransferase [Megasphaera elsdenii]|nr:homoserine O-succinyltransferase [Megasphaera elsdenii]